MAIYQALVGGADLNTYGNWPFNGFVNPFNHTYVPAESNATTVVFSHPDGTKTLIHGVGLSSNTGYVTWTALTSIERVTSDNTVLERISQLDGIAIAPGSEGFGLLFNALMTGDDLVIGSSGSDWLRGGGVTNSVPGGGQHVRRWRRSRLLVRHKRQ